MKFIFDTTIHEEEFQVRMQLVGIRRNNQRPTAIILTRRDIIDLVNSPDVEKLLQRLSTVLTY